MTPSPRASLLRSSTVLLVAAGVVTGLAGCSSCQDASLARDTGLHQGQDGSGIWGDTRGNDSGDDVGADVGDSDDPRETDTGAPRWDTGNEDTGTLDSRAADTGTVDTGTVDTGTVDTGVADTGPVDTGTPDTGPADTGTPDTGTPDTGPADTGTPDTGTPDTGTPDTGSPDTGSPQKDTGPTPPPGLSTPCSQGAGWTLFKYHWGSRSGRSPRIDVWDPACSYSIRINDACGTFLIRNASFTGRTNVPILTRTQTAMTRFKVVPSMGFTKADVYVKARSYSTTASTKVEVWSPLYGSRRSTKLVDNDWVYDWYRVDWSGYLKPGDPHGRTAIEVRDAPGGSGKLAVEAVELCVR